MIFSSAKCKKSNNSISCIRPDINICIVVFYWNLFAIKKFQPISLCPFCRMLTVSSDFPVYMINPYFFDFSSDKRSYVSRKLSSLTTSCIVKNFFSLLYGFAQKRTVAPPRDAISYLNCCFINGCNQYAAIAKTSYLINTVYR